MSNQACTPEPNAVSVEGMAAIGRTTLYAVLGDLTLSSVKIGKRLLIRLEALRAWIAEQEIGSLPLRP